MVQLGFTQQFIQVHSAYISFVFLGKIATNKVTIMRRDEIILLHNIRTEFFLSPSAFEMLAIGNIFYLLHLYIL